MPWTDAFLEHEARHAAAVTAATWGHLAPEPRRVYTGHIVFAYGCYGDIVPVQAEFDGLDDSPWFFDDMNEYICDWIGKHGSEGTIYCFKGTYTKFKNGRYRFSGTVCPLGYKVQ